MQNTELTAQSILALFDTTKAQRESFVQSVVDSIENGEISALKVHIQLKSIEGIINSLTNIDPKKNKLSNLAKTYNRLLLDEAEQYGAKEFTFHGATISIRETGSKYDFSVCNDRKWEHLKVYESEVSEKRKQREEELKTIDKVRVETDPETGETFELFAPVKSSKTSVIVSLK